MMRIGPLGWPDLHGLTEDVDEHTQEHEEHEEHQEERPEHKNTHKIQEPFPLPVGPTGPIESTRRWRDRQVDTRRDLGWLFLQRSTEPLQ